METSLLVFLLLVAVGGYIQTVAGFAMGMIIIAGTGALGLFDLPTTTAVVSLVSLLNIVLSLRGHTHRIHRPGLRWLIIGQIPAVALGVALLNYLDATAERLLRMALGVFIIAGCGAMMLRPEPRRRLSGAGGFLAAGFGGGVLGGMFSASGPVMGWFVYRQPLQVPEIRATLLSAFAASTLTRTLVVGADGGLTGRVLALTAWSVPLVLLSVWLGRRFPPPFGERALRRAAFALLLAMGVWILVAAATVAPVPVTAGAP